MSKKSTCFALFISITLFFHGMDNELWSEILTFEQAIAQAKEHNLDLNVHKAKYIQAHSLVYKTISAYLPRIQGTGNYTRNSDEASINMPISPTETKTLVIQPKNQMSAQVQLSQMVLSPWLISQLTSLKKYEESIRLGREHARREILFAVAQLYYGMASSMKAIAIQKKLLDGRKNREREAQLKFDQGYIIKAELLRAQIDAIKNEQDVILAENTYLANRLALATMLNRDPDFDIEEPPPPKKPTEQEVTLSNVFINRFDLRSSRLQADVLQNAMNNSFWRYFPELSFFMQYKGSDTENMGGNKHLFAFGLNLTWNIFDGGMREMELYENSGKSLEALTNARIKERQIQRDTEIAKLELKSAEANKEKAIKQVELARESFRVISKSNELGAASYLEYSDANDNLASAEIGVITQSLQADLAALKLQHALGIFE